MDTVVNEFNVSVLAKTPPMSNCAADTYSTTIVLVMNRAASTVLAARVFVCKFDVENVDPTIAAALIVLKAAWPSCIVLIVSIVARLIVLT